MERGFADHKTFAQHVSICPHTCHSNSTRNYCSSFPDRSPRFLPCERPLNSSCNLDTDGNRIQRLWNDAQHLRPFPSNWSRHSVIFSCNRIRVSFGLLFYAIATISLNDTFTESLLNYAQKHGTNQCWTVHTVSKRNYADKFCETTLLEETENATSYGLFLGLWKPNWSSRSKNNVPWNLKKHHITCGGNRNGMLLR